MRKPQPLTAVAIALGAIVALLALRAAVHESPWDRLRDGKGTIELPRPGRYVFGAQSASPPTITVDGKDVRMRGERDLPGVWVGSIDLDAGTVSFEVSAPDGGRLLWHPPGRRGPPEYLPASALGGTGVPVDGLILIAIGLIGAGLALFLLWPRLRILDRRDVAAGAAIFALALGVRLWDLGGAGQTFDEDVTWSAGRNQAQNRLDLDVSQRAWIWNFQHPPVTKDIAGVGALLADGYGPARALSALALALACALIVAIGRRLWDRKAGIAAGVAAALTPHLIAHGKVVGHEAPTVLWWTLALWLCLRAFDHEPDRRLLVRRFVWIGVVLGLAISTRWVNMLLAPMIGATLLLWSPRALLTRTLALGAAVIPATALLTCIVLWPRLWSDPFGHIDAARAIVSKGHGAEPFLGRMTEHPSHAYFLVYLIATAPLGILVGAVAGLAQARRKWRSVAIALLLFLLPLAAEFSPVRQDGVRYVLPSVVALALLCGAGFALIPTARRGYPSAIAALTLYLAIACARIHPYYLDYYGEVVGGPAGVARGRDFEVGWWGEGVDAAVRHVSAHRGPDETVFRDCIAAVHLAWWDWGTWQHLARTPGEADWIVVQPAYQPCKIPKGFDIAHEVTAMGAPLVRVYHRAAPPPGA